MIQLKIAVNKINKDRLFRGKKDTYLDAVLFENKHGTDEFGNDGFIAEDVSKEERSQGIRGAIIGNWKRLGEKRRQETPAPRTSEARRERPIASRPAPDPDLDAAEDDIPF